MNILDFPDELLCEICLNLELEEAIKCQGICSRFHNLLQTDTSFWMNLILRRKGKGHQNLFEYSLKLFNLLNRKQITNNLGQLCYHIGEELAFKGAEYIFSIERCLLQAGRQAERQNSEVLKNYFIQISPPEIHHYYKIGLDEIHLNDKTEPISDGLAGRDLLKFPTLTLGWSLGEYNDSLRREVVQEDLDNPNLAIRVVIRRS